MISKEDIKTQINNIPAIPKFVKLTIYELNNENITKAAKHASNDLAFLNYLKSIVNKPIFGFVNEVKEPQQIFTILGLSKSIQVVYTYLISIIAPKDWKIFKLDNYKFQKFQLNLMYYWEDILNNLNLNTKENMQIITIIPYTFILVENIFSTFSDEISYLQNRRKLDFNKILLNTTGFDIYTLAMHLVKIWELPRSSHEILQYLKQEDSNKSSELLLARYAHLLIFFELSKPYLLTSGLNSFIEFKIDFVQSIKENFQKVVNNEE